jgi:hypothetical protein
MSSKAKVEIIETSNKNVNVGDKFKVNISTKKGSKIRGNKVIGRNPNKPKQQRKSKFDQILEFMKKQEEFNKTVIEKFDKLEGKVDNVIKLNNLKS